MPRRSDRRTVLKAAVAGAVTLPLLGTLGCAAPRRIVSGRVRHAGIGVGGMGGEDLKRLMSHPELDVVALCDIDANNLAAAAERCPDARTYRDWRELLANEELDSVHVTVPDHMHAPIMVEALRRGLHVYGQKPLTRTVHECRVVAAEAARAGVVTQMGIQNRSNRFYRGAHALFLQDRVGPIQEVHVWTDRPAGWWPQGVGRPAGSDPVPAHVDWDKWLGVAPERPYKEGKYHPFAWRGWKAFGTGAQGDMACHLMDPALWFLGLGLPRAVQSFGPAPNDETYPEWSRIAMTYAGTDRTAGDEITVTWYDGGRKPLEALAALGVGDEVYANASLFVGTEGALLVSPYEPSKVLPEERFDVPFPDVAPVDHWHQFVDAVRGQDVTTAPFAYAAVLSESALLGNVALHVPGERLEYDAERLRFPGHPEADGLLFESYREGWEVDGLSPGS